MESIPVITIDGPAGSGKGTIASASARSLQWHLLDSGALYRLVALAALQKNILIDAQEQLTSAAAQLDVTFDSTNPHATRVYMDGKEVSQAIRSEACGNMASQIATIESVRSALLQRQKDFRQLPGLIADGRDMGTVVFPDAPLKIYLTASAKERATRRQKQLQQNGVETPLDTLIAAIEARDERDMNRQSAPLKPAEDAHIINTDTMSIDEVIEKVMQLVQQVRITS